MKAILRYILLISLLSLLIKCDKDEITSRNYPRLKTLPVSDITSEGAIFNAEITLRGNFEILNYGFVWAESENPTKEINDRCVFAENIQSDNFSEIIETTLKEGTYYYVRAFIETNDFIVYGENVSFFSLGSKAPKIKDIFPLEGTIGDTVVISGNNFSFIEEQNKTYFNEIASELIFASDTMLKVIVPKTLTELESEIFVSIFGNKSSSSSSFKLTTPKINQFTPEFGTDNSEITIYGEGFTYFTNLNIVTIGNKGAVVTSATKTQLKVIIPFGILTKENELSVMVASQKGIANVPFKMLAPIIADFEPKEASIREFLTIKGENFSTTQNGNQVYFDTARANIIEVSATSIVAEVPYGVHDSVKIEILTAEQEEFSDEYFQILTPELQSLNPQKATFNKEITITGNNFSPLDDDNKVQFNGITANLLSSSKTTLRVSVPSGIDQRSIKVMVNTGGHDTAPIPFELVGGEWSMKNTFPGDHRSGAIMANIENTIYFGLGIHFITPLKDFWKYDAMTEVWTKLSDFPGEARLEATSFVINDKVYVGLGRNSPRAEGSLSDFWEYNPNTDSWHRLPDFPGEARQNASSFVHLESAFVGLGGRFKNSSEEPYYVKFSDFYEFNTTTQEWNAITPFPGGARSSASVFVINQKAYVGFGALEGSQPANILYSSDFWSFDLIEKNWSQIASFPGLGRESSTSFSINSRGYIGLGARTVDHGTSLFDSFYEYDPVSDTWTETVPNRYGEGYGANVSTVNGKAFMMSIGRSNQNPGTSFEIFDPYE